MKYTFILIFIFLISLVYAWEEDSTCGLNEKCNFVYWAVNSFDSSETFPGALCTIDITNLNSTVIVNNGPMQNNSDGSHNYTIKINDIGNYKYLVTCCLNLTCGSYGGLFKVDETLSERLTEINQTSQKIWGVTIRTNQSVLTNETITNSVLNTTNNITIFYSISTPETKEGFEQNEYLPTRLKYYFIDNNENCKNQGNDVLSPACNPLTYERPILINSTYNFTQNIKPTLPTGNYSIVRELEIDPRGVWEGYGREKIGDIFVDNGAPIKKTNTNAILKYGAMLLVISFISVLMFLLIKKKKSITTALFLLICLSSLVGANVLSPNITVQNVTVTPETVVTTPQQSSSAGIGLEIQGVICDNTEIYLMEHHNKTTNLTDFTRIGELKEDIKKKIGYNADESSLMAYLTRFEDMCYKKLDYDVTILDDEQPLTVTKYEEKTSHLFVNILTIIGILLVVGILVYISVKLYQRGNQEGYNIKHVPFKK